MRRGQFVLITMILTVAAMTFAATRADTLPATTQSTQPATTAASVGPPVIDNVKEIQTILARTVEAGASKADFDTLVSFVARPDRGRIGEARTQTWPDLDGRIDQFRKDWQAKYGQDFKMTDKPSVVFNDKTCAITVGSADGGSAHSTTAPSTRSVAAVKMATVQIPAARGTPAVSLKLVNEGTLVPSWRIDIPDNIDGSHLHDNLLTHLTAFDEDKNNWPSDVTLAYNLVSHHVLAALASVPVAATQPATTTAAATQASQ